LQVTVGALSISRAILAHCCGSVSSGMIGKSGRGKPSMYMHVFVLVVLIVSVPRVQVMTQAAIASCAIKATNRQASRERFTVGLFAVGGLIGEVEGLPG